MSKPEIRIDGPISARVVHKSVIVDQPGVASVAKLMFNITPDNRQFVTGAGVAFFDPGSDLEVNDSKLRYFTIESVGEVPFEDTLDITVYVREPQAGEASETARMLSRAEQGDIVDLYGPIPYPFYPPMGSRSNMIMIGAGCGMVPFRWLALKIHERKLDWMGKVLMLEGQETGLEHLYMNDSAKDQDQYFDQVTYRAFEALKTRYSANALDREASAMANMEAMWRLLGQGSVYVYLAGYRANAQALDDAMSTHLRLADRWLDTKAELIRDGHWLEYLYD